MNKVVFPLDMKKAPAVPKDTDWRKYKGKVTSALVGIMIPKGAFVIDIDTYKGVTREAIETLLGCSLEWDDALLQGTLNGGEHYAFSVPEDVDLINSSDVLGLVGFDTRSSGKGYIATGKGYTDQTMFGVIDTLHETTLLPKLPEKAIGKLVAGNASTQLEEDDLMGAIAEQPLELSFDEVRAYMNKLTDEHARAGSTWLRVGMALYHQFKGDEKGWKLFDRFSKLAPEKYEAKNNRKRWDSFGKSRRTNPVTFASVIDMVGGREVVVADKVEVLLNEASEVKTRSQYDEFKRKVQKIPEFELPSDTRSMIAGELALNFGKDEGKGLTKTDIKKALAPPKKEKRLNGEVEPPEWCADWVYVENTCEFANTRLNYAIKREAFNAKFDRMVECVIAEKTAAHMALNIFHIETVVDKMFWPGADMVFEYEGKKMLNGYFLSGVEACETINEDGQSVIDMVLEHVKFSVSDEREQRILIDWLAYIVKNPGKRVNWALLLQGAQGSGKSYFVKLLQYVMGEHVRNLDPTAIAGRFTGWAHGSLVIGVEEIRISGTNRYEVLDRMKPFITNDTIQIEEKGRDHRTVPNFTSYLMLTNHKDAIPLTSGDRRYCVIFSRIQSEEQLYKELGGEKGAEAYFEKLFNETGRRADALKRWLLDWELSAEFNPQGRAPDTKARQMMMSVSTSPERLAVEDAIAEHQCAVINSDVLDITWLNELCENAGNEIPKNRTLTAILLEMGYEQVEGKRVKIAKTGKHHYVWVGCGEGGLTAPKDIVRNFHNGDDGECPF